MQQHLHRFCRLVLNHVAAVMPYCKLVPQPINLIYTNTTFTTRQEKQLYLYVALHVIHGV